MNIIFPKNYFDDSVDETYQFESDLANRYGFNISVLSYEDLLNNGKTLNKVNNTLNNKELTLWRGWQITPKHYVKLIDYIKRNNCIPFSSYNEYCLTHLLSNSYEYIKNNTMETIFIDDSKIEKSNLTKIVNSLGGKVFVKDYVKSGCIIHDGLSEMEMHKTINDFKKKRDYAYTGGISIRKWTELHNEMRGIFINGKLIAHCSRENELFSKAKEHFPFNTILPSPFYMIDVAQNSKNEWLIIETGDGQVSEIPNFLLDKVYSKLVPR